MNEQQAIAMMHQPNTKDSLVKELRQLGVQTGDLLIAHASLSKLGWVCGREITVLDALLEAIGETGTLIMPSQTGDNSDPEKWCNPPVPKEWVPIIKASMPPYDPDRSPTRGMGKIVDALLAYPGRIRSSHPQVSFCGHGPLAAEILADHQLSPGLGSGSPLQKLYDHQAKILLLGVDYGNCTSLHLAESHLPFIQWERNGAMMRVGQQIQWIEFDEIQYDDSDFTALGQDFEREHPPLIGKVGAATCRLIDMQTICQYADQWFLTHRQ